MLSRKSLLKSGSNIKQEVVEYKEAGTPALVSPGFHRHTDPHRKVKALGRSTPWAPSSTCTHTFVPHLRPSNLLGDLFGPMVLF